MLITTRISPFKVLFRICVLFLLVESRSTEVTGICHTNYFNFKNEYKSLNKIWKCIYYFHGYTEQLFYLCNKFSCKL